jgi:hypothetical protein
MVHWPSYLYIYPSWTDILAYYTDRITDVTVSAREGLVLRQFDICTAFLNGELEEEVYVRAPVGAEHLAVGKRRVLQLRSPLYGLRQAPRAWNECLERKLRAKGFEQSESDPSLWLLHDKGGRILVMFYVDDGLVAARTIAEADGLVRLVGSMFDIRELGEPTDFLGIQIIRDKAAGTITIHQTDKALALAKALKVGGTRKATPILTLDIVINDTRGILQPAVRANWGAHGRQGGVSGSRPQPIASGTMYQTRFGLGCWGTGQVLLGSECRTPCSSSRRSQVCVVHSLTWHHFWPQTATARSVVRCQFCCLSGYKTEHHRLGRRNVWGSCGMGKQKAANYSCFYNGG